MKNYSEKLRDELSTFAIDYAKDHNLPPYTSRKTAVIFENIQDNFHPKSWIEIKRNPAWEKRTYKKHSQVPGKYEMQSSNSSDSLLMNIFCYPGITKWTSLTKLFGIKVIAPPVFGYNPALRISGKPEASPTEVDMQINNEIIYEAKLTEKDFTSDNKQKIESYDDFDTVFEKSLLEQTDNQYANYQLIRNILAANKHDYRFVLLCDMRRPDLVKAFTKTVICIKSPRLRTNCEIIFWQDIARCVGNDLQSFLNSKYGIF